LTEGAEVPRNVEVRSLPQSLVQKVPKLRGYTFFTAEKRIGIRLKMPIRPRSGRSRVVRQRKLILERDDGGHRRSD
jgi:hypothetical protein